MQYYLTTYVEGLVAATVLLTGKQCEQVMDNPVFESTTPSEFWTVRWNTLAQGVLKVRFSSHTTTSGAMRAHPIHGY